MAPRLWVLTDGKIGDDVQCLAVARALSPAFEKRVIAPRALFAALAPWGPITSPEVMASLNRLDRLFASLARRAAWTLSLGFAPMGWLATHKPELFLRLLRSVVSPPDQHILAHPSVARLFAAMKREAFRQGSRGPAHDAYLAYSDWGFDLASNRVPIHMWLGDDDIFVPTAMGQHLAQTVPHMNTHWMPGSGHLAYEAWDAIFAACRAEIS